MKLSRKKAIKLCIELWEWLSKTGKKKKEWPRWIEFEAVKNLCWFCEYNKNQFERYKTKSKYNNRCKYCPYNKKFAYQRTYSCEANDSPYEKWFYLDEPPKDKKKYAKLFLEQIKKCI